MLLLVTVTHICVWNPTETRMYFVFVLVFDVWRALSKWRMHCGLLCRVVGGFETLTAMENVESHPKTDKPKVRVRDFKCLCWFGPKIDFLPGNRNKCSRLVAELLQLLRSKRRIEVTWGEIEMTMRSGSFIQLFRLKIMKLWSNNMFFLFTVRNQDFKYICVRGPIWRGWCAGLYPNKV